VEEGFRACEGLRRWEELHHWAYLAEIYAHNSVSWPGLMVVDSLQNCNIVGRVDRVQKYACLIYARGPDVAWVDDSVHCHATL
jgi:hypothetical protein